MGNILSFGNCNKKLIYLIFYTTLTILVFFVSIKIYMKYHLDNIEVKLRLQKNYLYNFFLEYLGYFLCIIPDKFNKKNLNKIQKKKPELNENASNLIYYIFNDPLDEKILSTKEIFILIFICLLSLFKRFSLLFVDILNKSEANEDYNFYEYILFYITSIYILKRNYYKHQFISIIFIVLLGIVKYAIKKTYLEVAMNYYILILDLFNSILTCIIYGYVKGLMEYKYFSIYKSAYVFGMIDVPAIIILYFIISYIPSEGLLDTNDCILYKGRYYFDNIYSFISNFNFIDIIPSILYIIGSGLQQLLINKIINDFTILHIALPFEIHELIYNIIEIKQKYVYVLWVIIFCSFFEFFFFFVFLEIIELKFCGLNYNTEKNIRIRSITESMIDYMDDNISENSFNEEDIFKTKEQELGQETFLQ